MRATSLLIVAIACSSIPTATAAAEPAETGRISGRVLDAAGNPVAHAAVRLHRWDSDRSLWLPSKRAVESDDDGRYEFAELANENFAVAIEADGFARAYRSIYLEEGQQATLNVSLRNPVNVAIQLRDNRDQPISNARLRMFVARGGYGEFWLAASSSEIFDVKFQPSDETGRLELPPLPQGSLIDVYIDHSEMAPVKLEDFNAEDGAVADLTMQPGVKVAFRLHPPELARELSEVQIRLYHVPFDHPSTVYDWYPVDAVGTARVTVHPGAYRARSLTSVDFYISPRHYLSEDDPNILRLEPGVEHAFDCHLHRKVEARGRVIDAGTGQPFSGVRVAGQIPNGPDAIDANGTVADWMHAAWAETDEKGEYTIQLAAGPARVWFSKEEHMSDEEYLEITVADDGSTVIPDGRLHPTPTVTGRVIDAEGRPAPNAIVRFRGEHLRHLQPTRTDERGRFTLQLKYFPEDSDTEQRVLTHPLVAFDAYHPLAARIDVSLDEPATYTDVSLALKPQSADALINTFPEEFNDWLKGELSTPELQAKAKSELSGQRAPELDCSEWLNVPDGVSSLADFRGKYVLLDFWTTWCGPCRGDAPSVKLAHELYKDRGLVVIGVHDNSVPIEAIREFVAKENYEFPIAVDHPDGRTIAAYENCGVTGYPSYLLIGPDGEILHSDSVLPGPTLRTYKLEIIRSYLLAE